ncbi:MAG: hypothetical protein ABWW66_07400 [Archaeoglobaceae archaeon]
MRVTFDENIANDYVECWGITVHLLKSTLFARTREERFRILSEKIRRALEEFSDFISGDVRVSLASAWVRYYVFRVEADGTYALLVLSPDSPVGSFKKCIESLGNLLERFAANVAKPLAFSDEFMLQEWVNAKPLSEFRDGDVLVDVENARKCIELAGYLLWKLNEEGYVYHPWDDYELAYDGEKLIFLDVTRFVRKTLSPAEFFDFYFGAPFTPPEIIKPSDDPAHRLYYRGVSEKDYFGTSREEYVELFLKGVRRASRQAYEAISSSLQR